MKRVWKQLCIALAFVMAATFFTATVAPTTVEAKTYSVNANTNYKKAPALKLKRVYLVKAKKNHSLTKFTAPSNGTYMVTISNIHNIGVKKDSEKDSDLGNLYVRKNEGGYLFSQTVKTQGGKTNCLFTATPYSYNRFYKGKKVTTGTYLRTRTATISLKKGTTIYLDYYFTGGKCTYNLQVKKK